MPEENRLPKVLYSLWWVVAILLVVAGCKTEVMVEVYSSDLRVAAGRTTTVPGEITIQTSVGQTCVEFAEKVRTLGRAFLEDFILQDCKKEGIDTAYRAKMTVPVFPTREQWEASPAPLGVVILDQPEAPPRHILVLTVKPRRLSDFQVRLFKAIHREMKLAQTRVAVHLHNDERAALPYAVEGGFVDGQPQIGHERLTLKRRGRVRVVLSDVHTKYLAKNGAVAVLTVPWQQ